MTEQARAMFADLNADTRQVPRYDEMTPSARRPAVTLLYHPRLRRIGERALLPELMKTGARAAISRLTPELAPPFNPGAALPLASPFVSRRPIWIQAEHDGAFTFDVVESGTALVVDGTSVQDSLTVPASAVERGVVLDLGGQVVLLFHLAKPQETPPDRYGLVGDSDGIAEVRRHIARVAKVDAPVLVRGETGTGKELVAKAVHGASDRSERPYLTVNMAAIPATLAASELFGHVRGAFSGAKGANDGFFGRADKGTLFMDEVGDTPAEVQAALLRTLETGEVQQIGAERVRTVDVRLIAATDAQIEREVEAGRFRAPLYYRLANQEIVLPPLRARRDDVGRLLVHFLEVELMALGRGAALNAMTPDGVSWLPAPIVARLARYHWPGNVRQLRNVARYLASLEHDGGVIRVDEGHLNQLLPLAKSAVLTADHDVEAFKARLESLGDMAGVATKTQAPPKRTAPSDIGEAQLEETLTANEFKLGPTAKALGISRPALNELVDRHPTFVRANNLTAEDIAAARAQVGDDAQLWRALKVSKRGLKLRMKDLGLV